MPRSPQRMDLYQILFRRSSRGRNQLCGILLQSANFDHLQNRNPWAISHWLGRSPLTQCWRYRAACDNSNRSKTTSYQSAIVSNILSCTILELFQYHDVWNLGQGHWRSLGTLRISPPVTLGHTHFHGSQPLQTLNHLPYDGKLLLSGWWPRSPGTRTGPSTLMCMTCLNSDWHHVSLCGMTYRQLTSPVVGVD